MNREDCYDEEPYYLEESGSQKDHSIVLNHPETNKKLIFIRIYRAHRKFIQ